MRTTPLSVSQKLEGQVDVFCSIDDKVEKLWTGDHLFVVWYLQDHH